MKNSLLICGVLVGAAAISGAALAQPQVRAETARASVNVVEACNMTSTGNTSHVAEVENGRYVSDIGATTLNVTCNDASGFSIYAVGYTGEEIGGTNSTKLVGVSSSELISTGTATSGSTSNWAMKLTTNGSATYPVTLQNGFGSYSAVPASYTKVATRAAGTDTGTGAVGATLTTTYAAFVNNGQTADTYNGKVLYTLVHPASDVPAQPQPSTAGCINYFANASSAVGTMGCQSATDNASVTLLASNFSRAGYGFAGWSDKYDYATNSNAKFYGPQETITAPVGTTADGLSLYAVWVKSEGSLQDATKIAELCGTGPNALATAPTDGTANLDSVSALTDRRDNQTYAIAKLVDGQCWMIENLRLESRDTVDDNRFDSSITNASLAQGYDTSGTYGNFGGLADAESTNFSDSTTANSLYYSGTQSGTASINIRTTSYPGYRMPRYNNLNTTNRATNPTSNTFTNDNTTGGMYSYGNYYTWHAAIADTTYYSSGDHNTTSICPTGWQLPLGNTSTGDIAQGAADAANKVGGFSYLDRKLGGTGASQSTAAASLRWRTFPNNFLYSGYFDTSSARSRGSSGYYWSSTASSYHTSDRLYLSSSYVYPGAGGGYKYLGNSIRCTVSAGT